MLQMDLFQVILSISGCWFVRENNEFVFPDPESPLINVLYGWSGICDQFELSPLKFSFVTSLNLIVFYHFIILLHLICFFYFTRSLLVLYAYVSIKSIDFILLPELKAILFIFSAKKYAFHFWIFAVVFTLICCLLWILFFF